MPFLIVPRERPVRLSKADEAAALKQQREAAYKANQQRLKEEAQAQDVPPWVVHIREELAKPGFTHKPKMTRRHDGSYYWTDGLGRFENLPSSAVIHFPMGKGETYEAQG